MRIFRDLRSRAAAAVGLALAPRTFLAEALATERARVYAVALGIPASALEGLSRVEVESLCRAVATHGLDVALQRNDGPERVEWYVARDAVALDDDPDDCWRCDAAPAATAAGLCVPCRDDLRKTA